jgi:hypothetical protein
MAKARRFHRTVDLSDKQWIEDFQGHIGTGAFGGPTEEHTPVLGPTLSALASRYWLLLPVA